MPPNFSPMRRFSPIHVVCGYSPSCVCVCSRRCAELPSAEGSDIWSHKRPRRSPCVRWIARCSKKRIVLSIVSVRFPHAKSLSTVIKSARKPRGALAMQIHAQHIFVLAAELVCCMLGRVVVLDIIVQSLHCAVPSLFYRPLCGRARRTRKAVHLALRPRPTSAWRLLVENASAWI